jgi:hypothetical protein
MSVLCTTSPDHLLYPLMEKEPPRWPDVTAAGHAPTDGAEAPLTGRLHGSDRRSTARPSPILACGCMLLLETTGIYLRLPVSTPGRSESVSACEDDDPRRPNSCAVHGGRLTQRLAAWRDGPEVFNVCPGLFRMWNNAASLSESGSTGRGGHHVLAGSGPPEP